MIKTPNTSGTNSASDMPKPVGNARSSWISRTSNHDTTNMPIPEDNSRVRRCSNSASAATNSPASMPNPAHVQRE